MGITKKQMEALARKHGVRGARDLVDRRRELPISDVLRRKLELAPCGSDAYPNSHIPMDVQETKQIHGILESAARFIGLHMTVVGNSAEIKLLRRFSRPRLNHDLHAIDATPARRRHFSAHG